MKLILLVLVVLMTGCAADMRCPPNGCPPIFLPPPQPMTFTPVRVPMVTTCTQTYGGFRCTTTR